MLKSVEVVLWDTVIGRVSLAEGDPIVRFEYSQDIRDLGVELSPLHMPLGRNIYRFPDL